MNDALFAELVESVREGGEILQGKKEPSRQFTILLPDVKKIREQYELTQGEFASLMGVSIKTLQNWEQGLRTPQGAARILLHIFDKHPNTLWDIVQPVTV